MRRTLVIVAVALQALVLAYMAGSRELIALTGTVVYLRTAPVDPRDIFRGDYVRLRYEASTAPYSPAGSAGVAEPLPVGRTVYAELAVAEGGLAHVTRLSETKPGSGLFLKGKTADSWRFGFAGSGMVSVEYGIEAYFVEQGKGLELEKRVGTRNTLQTPLEMEVAVSRDGVAVIRGYRWSPLGMGIEIVESPQQNTSQGRKSARMKLTLKNSSEKPLAIVMLPFFCSFSLEPASHTKNVAIQDRPSCAGLTPTDNDVVLLGAQESRSYDIDLAERQWQVLKGNELVETGTLDWSERFRIVYASPSKETTAGLSNAGILWHGKLPSGAFHGRGRVD